MLWSVRRATVAGVHLSLSAGTRVRHGPGSGAADIELLRPHTFHADATRRFTPRPHAVSRRGHTPFQPRPHTRYGGVETTPSRPLTYRYGLASLGVCPEQGCVTRNTLCIHRRSAADHYGLPSISYRGRGSGSTGIRVRDAERPRQATQPIQRRASRCSRMHRLAIPARLGPHRAPVANVPGGSGWIPARAFCASAWSSRFFAGPL